MYDTAIVGGGPCGNYIAHRLAGLGHRVAVLEEHGEIGQPVTCTGIVGRECLDRFAIPREVISAEFRSAKLFPPSGTFVRLEKETVQGYAIDRAGLDAALGERAQREGAEYLLGSRVKDIVIDGDGVKVEAECQGRRLSLAARTAVIADGFGSRLPCQLGLGVIGDWVIGAQAEVEAPGIEEIEVYFGHLVAPGFFAWLVPIAPHKARVGLFSRHSPQLYMKNLLADLGRQGKISRSEAPINYGGIPLKTLPRTYRDRVVVVGDAAGQVKPTTGGGIYYGLLCAEIASDVLGRALVSGDLSQKAFARYERGWRARLGRELRIGRWARKLYEGFSDRQIDEVFDIIVSNGIHHDILSATDFSFDWHGQSILKGLMRLGPWWKPMGRYHRALISLAKATLR